MSDKPHSKSPLTSLLASALALPGIAGHAQQEGDDQIDYRFTRYDEDALPAGIVLFGDPARYEIETHQFRLRKSINEQYSLTVNALYEVMSGSSPIYVLPGPDGPLQILSGATISDRRSDLSFNLSREQHAGPLVFSAGVSTEDDYTAFSGGVEKSINFDNKHTTLSLGMSFSFDDIEPTDAIENNRVEDESKRSYSLYTGITRIINRNSVIQSGLQVSRQHGFLSDPYKLTFVDNSIDPDSRPNTRWQFAWSTRYRQFVNKADAAFHADYRLFRDQWSVTAHTLDIAWHQTLPGNWKLVPSLRYHSQSAADFYAPFHTVRRADGYHSSDYRLGTFGAFSAKLELTRTWGQWQWSISAESYNSSTGKALGGADAEVPGLVDFSRYGIGFTRTL